MRTVFSTDLDECVEAMSGLSDIWTRMRVVTGRRFRCTLASRSFPSIACASGTITPAIYEVDGQRTEQTTFLFLHESSTTPTSCNRVRVTAVDLFIRPSHIDHCRSAAHPSAYSVTTIPDEELVPLLDEPFSVEQQIPPSAQSLAHLRHACDATMRCPGNGAASLVLRYMATSGACRTHCAGWKRCK